MELLLACIKLIYVVVPVDAVECDSIRASYYSVDVMARRVQAMITIVEFGKVATGAVVYFKFAFLQGIDIDVPVRGDNAPWVVYCYAPTASTSTAVIRDQRFVFERYQIGVAL